MGLIVEALHDARGRFDHAGQFGALEAVQIGPQVDQLIADDPYETDGKQQEQPIQAARNAAERKGGHSWLRLKRPGARR